MNHKPAPASKPEPIDARYLTEAQMIYAPNGAVLVKPAKLVVVKQEIGTREFARLAGMSQRNVQYLCEIGKIPNRRPGGAKRGGNYLIPLEEAQNRLKNEA